MELIHPGSFLRGSMRIVLLIAAQRSQIGRTVSGHRGTGKSRSRRNSILGLKASVPLRTRSKRRGFPRGGLLLHRRRRFPPTCKAMPLTARSAARCRGTPPAPGRAPAALSGSGLQRHRAEGRTAALPNSWAAAGGGDGRCPGGHSGLGAGRGSAGRAGSHPSPLCLAIVLHQTSLLKSNTKPAAKRAEPR